MAHKTRKKRVDPLRTPKTLVEKVQALDQHLFLLRTHLHSLKSESAHLKGLSAELRVIVCYASGTEGLLWRLVKELAVSDLLPLQTFSKYNRDHPMNRGLAFATVPLFRAGTGPLEIPAGLYSLRELIKTYEAVFLPSVSSLVTHEMLIRKIAEQIGGAHEDDDVDPDLLKLRRILINGLEPYVPILALDSELVLQIGERVLRKAEQSCGYRRLKRADSGDVTLALRVRPSMLLLGKIPVVTLNAPVCELTLSFSAGPQSLTFRLEKAGLSALEFEETYLPDWRIDTGIVCALSYSSWHRKARAVVNDRAGSITPCDIGWLDARELAVQEIHVGKDSLIRLDWIRTYGRLLGGRECGELFALFPDLGELLLSGPPEEPFPECPTQGLPAPLAQAAVSPQSAHWPG